MTKSYFLTEYVVGPNFDDIIRSGKGTAGKRSVAARPILELIDKLAKYCITHGDLKHTNILVTDSGPVLTDLDGMKVHWWNCTCQRRKANDLESFNSRGRNYG